MTAVVGDVHQMPTDFKDKVDLLETILESGLKKLLYARLTVDLLHKYTLCVDLLPYLYVRLSLLSVVMMS